MTLRSSCSGVLVVPAAVGLDARGWAVIAVKDLPDFVVVGRPVTLTYAVRQHGRALLTGLDGRLEMRLGAHVVHAAAMASSESGQYSVTFTLPCAGDWTIDIISGFAGMGASRLIMHAIASVAPVLRVSEEERGRRGNLTLPTDCKQASRRTHVHDAVR